MQIFIGQPNSGSRREEQPRARIYTIKRLCMPNNCIDTTTMSNIFYHYNGISMQRHLIIINNIIKKNTINIVFLFACRYLQLRNNSVVCAKKKLCWSHVLTIYQIVHLKWWVQHQSYFPACSQLQRILNLFEYEKCIKKKIYKTNGKAISNSPPHDIMDIYKNCMDNNVWNDAEMKYYQFIVLTVIVLKI